MRISARRDLQLLSALYGDSLVTQRVLAGRFGMALGLTNGCLKRLAESGYIRCISASPRGLQYVLTPRGIAQKLRLTREFIKYSVELYAGARRKVGQTVEAVVQSGNRRIALYGTDEIAELAYLCIRDAGLEPIAIVANGAMGPFLGYPVRSLRDIHALDFDVVLVASLDPTTTAIKRLVSHGVKRNKIVNLAALLDRSPSDESLSIRHG